MDEFNKIPPADHSFHMHPLQEINGLIMRPKKGNSNHHENTETPTVCNAVPNNTGLVSHGIPKNYSHSASNSDSLQSSTLGIEANVESNLTDNDKPMPLSASAAQQHPEFDTIPTTTPVEDTTSHMIADNSYQQPWSSDGSGHVLFSVQLSQPRVETKNIANFCTEELSADLYQHQNSPSDDHPCAMPSLPTMLQHLQVPLMNPVQESNGQSDTSGTYQTATVYSDECFVVSPANQS